MQSYKLVLVKMFQYTLSAIELQEKYSSNNIQKTTAIITLPNRQRAEISAEFVFNLCLNFPEKEADTYLLWIKHFRYGSNAMSQKNPL